MLVFLLQTSTLVSNHKIKLTKCITILQYNLHDLHQLFLILSVRIFKLQNKPSYKNLAPKS